jgi:hypothetical protein
LIAIASTVVLFGATHQLASIDPRFTALALFSAGLAGLATGRSTTLRNALLHHVWTHPAE